MLNLLILCTGNSCRSQMAEALVNHDLGNKWRAVSAGTEPIFYVHPLAVRALAELGIDIGEARSKSVEEFWDADFDLVITVCDDAAENCPVWLRQGEVAHIGFPDPANARGSLDEQMALFRQVRDDIRQRLVGHLAGWKGSGNCSAPEPFNTKTLRTQRRHEGEELVA